MLAAAEQGVSWAHTFQIIICKPNLVSKAVNINKVTYKRHQRQWNQYRFQLAWRDSQNQYLLMKCCQLHLSQGASWLISKWLCFVVLLPNDISLHEAIPWRTTGNTHSLTTSPIPMRRFIMFRFLERLWCRFISGSWRACPWSFATDLVLLVSACSRSTCADLEIGLERHWRHIDVFMDLGVGVVSRWTWSASCLGLAFTLRHWFLLLFTLFPLLALNARKDRSQHVLRFPVSRAQRQDRLLFLVLMNNLVPCLSVDILEESLRTRPVLGRPIFRYDWEKYVVNERAARCPDCIVEAGVNKATILVAYGRWHWYSRYVMGVENNVGIRFAVLEIPENRCRVLRRAYSWAPSVVRWSLDNGRRRRSVYVRNGLAGCYRAISRLLSNDGISEM